MALSFEWDKRKVGSDELVVLQIHMTRTGPKND